MSQTVLVADDSVTVRRVIDLTFADEGVTVLQAGDGDQALAMIEAAPPDVVLVDVALPNRNGYEIAAFVKARPALAHIPVVLLAGAREPVDEARAAEAGCQGTLTKPFEPQAVIACVRALLGGDVPPAPVAVADGNPGPAPAVSVDVSPEVFPEPAPATVGDLDAYFDRLDSAFASLPTTRPLPVVVDETLDGQAVTEPVDTPSPAYQVPSLAEAFAALLAAERGIPTPVGPSTRPAASGGAAEDEALVDRVAARVVAQLSEEAVRSRAADVLTEVAERLMRAEIERIRSSIR